MNYIEHHILSRVKGDGKYWGGGKREDTSRETGMEEQWTLL